uniref:Uncharacterized protein n=1 Tax=Anguilla anguilla TaxID=7936 RepID=A0A0E9S3T4_ANGAN
MWAEIGKIMLLHLLLMELHSSKRDTNGL